MERSKISINSFDYYNMIYCSSQTVNEGQYDDYQSLLYLDGLSARMWEIFLLIKVQRMNGEQTLILPHLERKQETKRKQEVNFASLPPCMKCRHRKMKDVLLSFSFYHFVALSLRLHVVILISIISV